MKVSEGKIKSSGKYIPLSLNLTLAVEYDKANWGKRFVLHTSAYVDSFLPHCPYVGGGGNFGKSIFDLHSLCCLTNVMYVYVYACIQIKIAGQKALLLDKNPQ